MYLCGSLCLVLFPKNHLLYARTARTEVLAGIRLSIVLLRHRTGGSASSTVIPSQPSLLPNRNEHWERPCHMSELVRPRGMCLPQDLVFGLHPYPTILTTWKCRESLQFQPDLSH